MASSGAERLPNLSITGRRDKLLMPYTSLKLTDKLCRLNTKIPFRDQVKEEASRYIEQLSKVFFKKENLRGKTWWLSVFYSLVIQSLVRAILKAIVADGGVEIPSSINQYLHLAVRLFVATSGAHDPLVHGIPVQGDRLKALVACDSCKRRKLKCTRWKPFCEACQAFQCPCVYGGKLEINDSEMEDYNFARLSVQQAEWQSSGLNSSGEYLQHMFQDDGQPITVCMSLQVVQWKTSIQVSRSNEDIVSSPILGSHPHAHTC
ncbi:similar to transcription factor Cys6 [Botrytis cinerea T4]|uniref:Similar to transcription factor Cys6 n=1 Tax=Botryotinia fuckeliana (strain T4) TaxID=999810 RepID=G2YFZ2_BOTF4|nr:similar to transcription factor Cys6 [Botrytis cinerea T4]